jgi:tetratricopeptide (TPR) repeat protein
MKKNERLKKILVTSVLVLLILSAWIPSRKIVAQKITNRGNYYFNGGEYDLKKAENFYKIALVFDNKNWEAHYQLARIDLAKGEFEDGLLEIDKALAIDHPQSNRAYYARGLLNGYAKNYSEAEKDFQSFIAWSPNEWPGYVDLSWIHINNREYDEAVAVTSSALVLFPQNTWLYANKGFAEYKAGEYEQAKADLEIASKLAKNMTPEEWKFAYPGNKAENANKGVEEIKTAIDYNLKLTYEKTADKSYVDIQDITFAEMQSLYKYAGTKDLSDGVTLSACGSCHL